MVKADHPPVPAEQGAVRKERGGKLRVALVYPNAYRIGMANLGLHAIYRLINDHPAALCERVFLPENGAEPRTMESARRLQDFDLVAFTIPFEDDYLHVLEILDAGDLPLRSAERRGDLPLVAAGGIAVQANPEPLSPFIDLFLIGDGEAIVPPLLEGLMRFAEQGLDRTAVLKSLALLTGSYVPSLYDATYSDTRSHGGEWVTRFTPRDGAPERVRRRWMKDLRKVPTSRSIDSPDAEFGDLFLTEVARGCLWGCRFCTAGFVQRPYREVGLDALRVEVTKGIAKGQRIGLVGADVSDHSGLGALTRFIGEQGGGFSPSSLRVDAVTPELCRRMVEGGERTITLAPEAGTERMRRLLNKDFTDARIVAAAESAFSQGMQHVKMYFMCGLPTETEEDILGMAQIAVRIREEVMKRWAKERGRMGRLSLSVNPFIPKPWTPFQWLPMREERYLKEKRSLLEKQLRPLGIDVDFLSPRQAYLQTLMSRGDRRCADLLEIAHRETGGDLRRAMERWPHDPDFFVHRVMEIDERLPWDFIDHGIEKRFLARELTRGLEARLTPMCAPDGCRACGLACADQPEHKPSSTSP